MLYSKEHELQFLNTWKNFKAPCSRKETACCGNTHTHTHTLYCAIKQIREAVVISQREGKNGASVMLPLFLLLPGDASMGLCFMTEKQAKRS
jgi:hypothetical protein